VTQNCPICVDPADGFIRPHKSILRGILRAPSQHLLDCLLHPGSVFRVNPCTGIFNPSGKRIASKSALAVSLVRPSHGVGDYIPIPQSDPKAGFLCQLQPLLPFPDLLFWPVPMCHDTLLLGAIREGGSLISKVSPKRLEIARRSSLHDE